MKTTVILLMVLSGTGLAVLTWAQESKPKPGEPASAAQSRKAGAKPRAESAGTVVAAQPPANTNEYSPSTDIAESAACKKNLETINAAIHAYRKDHPEVPNWLHELVP